MSGKSTSFRNALLQLIFNAVTIAGIARNDTAPITTIWVSLHSSDPSAGNQQTSELSYTGYTRIGITRSAAGWTITGAAVSPVGNIEFGISTAGAESTAAFVGFGTAQTGAGSLLFSGALVPSIAVNIGTIPRITSASTITEV